MAPRPLEFLELTQIDDPLLLGWLDLYEIAFPPNERMLVSYHLNLLKEKAQGGAGQYSMLAVVDVERTLKGIVQYQSIPEIGVVYLWYLAIQPGDRSQGLGSQVYRQMLERFDPATYQVLLFEVEKPELAENEEHRKLSERRITFYRRLGAQLLGGVNYLQSVGPHQPLTPMHIMIHALRPINPEEAYALAEMVFSETMQRVGPITLE
jgi:ribosomal protein S18 acetylase RimI-like enzyme